MEIKVPFYQTLNILLIGLVLSIGIIICFPAELQRCLHDSKPFWDHSDFISAMVFIAGSYELGLIVNRLGSIVMEPTMVRLKIIPFDNNYRQYNDLKKTFPILEVLSREYASSRTNVVLFIILSALHFGCGRCSYGISFLCVAILFSLSWRKHAGKIVTLMKSNQEKVRSLG